MKQHHVKQRYYCAEESHLKNEWMMMIENLKNIIMIDVYEFNVSRVS